MDSETTLNNIDEPGHISADRFEVGQIVAGKYEIVSLLGRGGMGTVYRVRHILLNMEMALKTLDTKHLSDVSTSRRFQTEAKAAFSLKHPNLVKVHDFGVLEDGHPFLVMDLVKGNTLQAVIKECGRLSLEDVGAIFAQLCFGLAHAHQQQVVHRDIKPANIMIVDGISLKNEGSVKILDFGIAKIVNSDRGEMQTLTQTGEIFGSPYYMSPEQCSGESIDQRCDIYSLGCVFFEALTGTPPLVGSNALRTMMLHVNDAPPSLKEATLGVEFPEALEQMVAKMLAKQPGDRYADIGAVTQELFKVCGITQSAQIDERNTQTGSVRSTAAARKGKSEIISLNYFQLAGLILATVSISVFGTLSVDRYVSKNALNTGKNQQNAQIKEGINELRSELLSSGTEEHFAAQKAFKDYPEIKATPINAKESEINFPPYSIGRIRYFALNGKTLRKEAKGKLVVPAHGPRYLHVNADQDAFALTNASIYQKVDPALFSGVWFAGPNLDVLYGSYTKAEKKLVDDGYDQFFATAGKWTNVGEFCIVDFALTQSIINSMDNMKLTFLNLNKITAPHGSWRNKHFFQTLTNISANGIEMTELLEELKHSPLLRELIISSNLTAHDIQLIGKLDRLDRLIILQEGLPDSVAAEVSKLTNVNDLRFNATTFNIKSITPYFKNWERTFPVGAERNQACLRRRQP